MLRNRSRWVALLALSATAVCHGLREDLLAGEELLIGWQGESFNSSGGGRVQEQWPEDRPWIETIAWRPRAFIYHSFLTHAECDHVIRLAKWRLQPSQIVDAQTGKNRRDPARTSTSAKLERGKDPIIAGIEQRIAEWTHVPPQNGEMLQVLRYVRGQEFKAHHDWFKDASERATQTRDGNRVATVLMYLSEMVEGGETSLPLAAPIDGVTQALQDPSECAAQGGLAVRPRKGDALLFWDLELDGRTGVVAALHASCPTTRGVKWTATKWLHSRGDYDPWDHGAGSCANRGVVCGLSALLGGCDGDDNARMGHMGGRGGACRLACSDCAACDEPADAMCARANARGRRSADAALAS
ncbi:hypothetical protein FOA52_011837 [Chlamydomonas sp. UWO 241]|nr:hypothetical protein FOA52_011837 [Chlamydomonas sp. UWO 241]